MKLTFLIHCPDQVGIISAVTNFLHQQGGNIIYLDQHVDKEAKVFFMRLECEFEKTIDELALKSSFENLLANKYQMQWYIHQEHIKPKMAVFVSKYKHCLYDILSRYQSGELLVEIPFILSNHKDLWFIAKQFDIPFYHVQVNKEDRAKADNEQLRLLQQHNVDFVVLARYMQIISPKVITALPNKIINIHHSFLPAFAGAKPYHAAFKRGVKIIGATSHYVTEELDAGPIIAQDVSTVTHSHSIDDLVARGRDLEKIVLSRAVLLHVHRKTMVYNNKTVIFS
ncbi:formyltetrahydrofolate deformylase [Allomuricauda sp. SCSIO 65647]|uniref:formyltetrahydrofolate deformylase n=1 Tax=Allomuricauda sp. SCSIO 65647 TaxID=2908843 RepID=UPI001F1E2477|nr:formyltetrahydrofolate deformylase [Muricauda sp. SCSIO 65647]UJH66760.1 formyltetrahydrofolate deformylase [Muricauda sp. SCSIO 65647]